MKECQRMGNSYLRLLSSLQDEPKKVMTIYTQSVSELLLVSEQIQRLDKLMNTGKVGTVECHGRINLSVDDSKETST